MQPNVGRTDAAVRWCVAAALFVGAIMLPEFGLSFLAAVLAVAIAGSALARHCPLYVPFGIDTRPRQRVAR